MGELREQGLDEELLYLGVGFLIEQAHTRYGSEVRMNGPRASAM